MPWIYKLHTAFPVTTNWKTVILNFLQLFTTSFIAVSIILNRKVIQKQRKSFFKYLPLQFNTERWSLHFASYNDKQCFWQVVDFGLVSVAFLSSIFLSGDVWESILHARPASPTCAPICTKLNLKIWILFDAELCLIVFSIWTTSFSKPLPPWLPNWLWILLPGTLSGMEVECRSSFL